MSHPLPPTIARLVGFIREGLALSSSEAARLANIRWWECSLRACLIEALSLELGAITNWEAVGRELEWLLHLLHQQQIAGRESYAASLQIVRRLEQQAAWFEEQLGLEPR